MCSNELSQTPYEITSYNNELNNAIRKSADLSMAVAVREAVMCNEDLSVALDGTWRGHTSHHGVVSATSKVKDVGILTKYCHACILHKNNKDTLKEHHESGKCKANYSGTSGGMEASGALKIFERSEEKYGVRYTKYLGDGDSRGFRTVVGRKPYDDNVEMCRTRTKWNGYSPP